MFLLFLVAFVFSNVCAESGYLRETTDKTALSTPQFLRLGENSNLIITLKQQPRYTLAGPDAGTLEIVGSQAGLPVAWDEVVAAAGPLAGPTTEPATAVPLPCVAVPPATIAQMDAHAISGAQCRATTD
mgnify:CR=1 FL=1